MSRRNRSVIDSRGERVYASDLSPDDFVTEADLRRAAEQRAAARARGEYVPTTAAHAAAIGVMQAGTRQHVAIQAAPVRDTVLAVSDEADPMLGREATVEVVCRVFPAAPETTTAAVLAAFAAEGIEAVEDPQGAVWTKTTTTITAGLARPH